MDGANTNKFPLPKLIEEILKNEENARNLVSYLSYFIVKVREDQQKIEIPEGISKEIEEDYVNSRKNDNKIGIEDLQRWIILAKIISACEGFSSVTFQIYSTAKKLDLARNERNVILHPNK